jgi:hypothetical protein
MVPKMMNMFLDNQDPQDHQVRQVNQAHLDKKAIMAEMDKEVKWDEQVRMAPLARWACQARSGRGGLWV